VPGVFVVAEASLLSASPSVNVAKMTWAPNGWHEVSVNFKIVAKIVRLNESDIFKCGAFIV
jgi:hypothetical protein